MVKGLAVTSDKKAAAEQIKALYNVFAKSDCTMVEVCTEVHFITEPCIASVQASDAACRNISGQGLRLCMEAWRASVTLSLYTISSRRRPASHANARSSRQ